MYEFCVYTYVHVCVLSRFQISGEKGKRASWVYNTRVRKIRDIGEYLFINGNKMASGTTATTATATATTKNSNYAFLRGTQMEKNTTEAKQSNNKIGHISIVLVFLFFMLNGNVCFSHCILFFECDNGNV